MHALLPAIDLRFFFAIVCVFFAIVLPIVLQQVAATLPIVATMLRLWLHVCPRLCMRVCGVFVDLCMRAHMQELVRWR